ncbi:MAG TPA: hypothetical protein VMI31_03195 [Fimbriimonadaceae bacterium]|nr:hypothetical protein [Fimbriimonadaceae bacterium]
MSRYLPLAVLFVLALAGCGGTVGGVSNNLTITPSLASTLPSGQVQFTLGEATRVNWRAPDGGTVVNGLFTAPTATGTYRVVASNGIDPNIQAVADVTVANVAVTVTPSLVCVAPGSANTNVFTALVTGSANKAVTWSISPQGAGQILSGSNDGMGNARATFDAGTTPGLYTVQATSSADGTVSGVAQVQVLGNLSVGLSPSPITLSATAPNNSVVLTAVVTNNAGNVDNSSSVTWDTPMNPVGGVLSGSDPRQRTFTVPTNFVGIATCQVRVRTGLGAGALATIQVVAN